MTPLPAAVKLALIGARMRAGRRGGTPSPSLMRTVSPLLKPPRIWSSWGWPALNLSGGSGVGVNGGPVPVGFSRNGSRARKPPCRVKSWRGDLISVPLILVTSRLLRTPPPMFSRLRCIMPSARNSSTPSPRELPPVGTSVTRRVVQPLRLTSLPSMCSATLASMACVNAPARAEKESTTSRSTWSSSILSRIPSMRVSMPCSFMVTRSMTLTLPGSAGDSRSLPTFLM
ncbi:MAG: hypothetical protein Q8O47_04150 [Candidatus Bathyarchaeota archaeon]|nr:hypothetical protein [Candidatus Bathyarchaeota archaeon]